MSFSICRITYRIVFIGEREYDTKHTGREHKESRWDYGPLDNKNLVAFVLPK